VCRPSAKTWRSLRGELEDGNDRRVRVSWSILLRGAPGSLVGNGLAVGLAESR
jgi:hypothetical protein